MAFQHLSIPQLKTMMSDSDIAIVDIRDQQSYLAGHIDSAIHLHQENMDKVLLSLDMDQPLVVCCYHGNSSQGAADYLNDKGFDHTYSLAGGYTAWTAQQN